MAPAAFSRIDAGGSPAGGAGQRRAVGGRAIGGDGDRGNQRVVVGRDELDEVEAGGGFGGLRVTLELVDGAGENTVEIDQGAARLDVELQAALRPRAG